MAEEKPFTFSAVVDFKLIEFVKLSVGSFNAELRYKYREKATLAVPNCIFVTAESFEKKKAAISRAREKYPDRIPVLVEKADKNGNHVRKKFLILHDFDVGSAFAKIWSRFHFEANEAPNPFYTIMSHEDPSAFEPLSSIYEKHKEDDGILYMTLTSAFIPLGLPVCTCVAFGQS